MTIALLSRNGRFAKGVGLRRRTGLWMRERASELVGRRLETFRQVCGKKLVKEYDCGRCSRSVLCYVVLHHIHVRWRVCVAPVDCKARAKEKV